MFVRKNLLSLVLILTFVLSACSAGAPTGGTTSDPAPVATEEMMKKDDAMAQTGSEMQKDDSMEGESMEKTPETEMMEKTPEAEMKDDSMKDDSMSSDSMSSDSMSAMPTFFSAALTNPRSMETFAIQDFKGKVVLVETLAMWCSNCLRQQKEVKALHELLGERDDFVSLGLDIDPNERPEDLKAYLEKNGFDWHYAVAPVEVAREIGQLYGDQFLNPPSTPMFIIDRHGEVHPLPFGIKSAADLQAALDPFLSEGM